MAENKENITIGFEIKNNMKETTDTAKSVDSVTESITGLVDAIQELKEKSKVTEEVSSSIKKLQETQEQATRSTIEQQEESQRKTEQIRQREQQNTIEFINSIRNQTGGMAGTTTSTAYGYQISTPAYQSSSSNISSGGNIIPQGGGWQPPGVVGGPPPGGGQTPGSGQPPGGGKLAGGMDWKRFAKYGAGMLIASTTLEAVSKSIAEWERLRAIIDPAKWRWGDFNAEMTNLAISTASAREETVGLIEALGMQTPKNLRHITTYSKAGRFFGMSPFELTNASAIGKFGEFNPMDYFSKFGAISTLQGLSEVKNGQFYSQRLPEVLDYAQMIAAMGYERGLPTDINRIAKTYLLPWQIWPNEERGKSDMAMNFIQRMQSGITSGSDLGKEAFLRQAYGLGGNLDYIEYRRNVERGILDPKNLDNIKKLLSRRTKGNRILTYQAIENLIPGMSAEEYEGITRYMLDATTTPTIPNNVQDIIAKGVEGIGQFSQRIPGGAAGRVAQSELLYAGGNTLGLFLETFRVMLLNPNDPHSLTGRFSPQLSGISGSLQAILGTLKDIYKDGGFSQGRAIREGSVIKKEVGGIGKN